MELRISHVALGVADIAASEFFYRQVMGLLPMGPASDGLALGHGTGHHVLELRPGVGVDHLGVEARGIGLDELARRLADDGHLAEQRDGAVWTVDPDGNRIELHGPVDRSGDQTTDGGFRPRRIDHITFGSPHVEAMVEFYVEVLGLRISDRMQDDFVWMRGSHHHHDVAVVRADAASLDHYSYEICSWENIRIWCDRFAQNRVPVTWGPGRHGPGNNLFIFVEDPDGFAVELSCEMEQFWDELIDYGDSPRNWTRSPLVPNLWGPLPPARIAITTEPGGA